LQVFRRMKETWTLEKLHQALAHVIVAVVLAIAAYTFMVAVNLFGIPMPGHPVLSVFHFFILATSTLWMSEKFPQQKVLGIPFLLICLLTIPLNLLSLVVALNKTGLVGFLSTAVVFIVLNQMFIYKTPYIEKLLNLLKAPQNVIIIGFAMAGSLMLLYAVDFFTLVADKISYYEKGFSSLSTLQVRTGNWFYFIHEWADTLNIQKFLFGFGAGEARKTIFYISAMRNSVNENNLVQTVHNNYMDSAYDFGLCTLLYHLPALLINIQNIKTIIDPNAPRSLKIFSLMSLTFIMYISIYAMMDGVRVQVSIVYYATLALVEGLRAQYPSLSTEHSKTGTKPAA
ncbi:MAG: hypothetical protein K2X66_01650, partial [Cyanobacteria bacterium]|nr:hypothetical protein [Cyanobacteriota bacterium]